MDFHLYFIIYLSELEQTSISDGAVFNQTMQNSLQTETKLEISHGLIYTDNWLIVSRHNNQKSAEMTTCEKNLKYPILYYIFMTIALAHRLYKYDYTKTSQVLISIPLPVNIFDSEQKVESSKSSKHTSNCPYRDLSSFINVSILDSNAEFRCEIMWLTHCFAGRKEEEEGKEMEDESRIDEEGVKKLLKGKNLRTLSKHDLLVFSLNSYYRHICPELVLVDTDAGSYHR